MELLKPHYTGVHPEMMKHGTEEARKVWFQTFNQTWEQTTDM